MSLQDFLWEKAEPLFFGTKDEFLKTLDGSDIKPVEIEGRLAFITSQKGPLFHFTSLDTGHRITLTMICDFLRPIIAEHGFAETRTPKHDERQHRFNKRFGFLVVGEDEFDTHFRIERLPHG